MDNLWWNESVVDWPKGKRATAGIRGQEAGTMQIGSTIRDDGSALFPYPEGWYLVTSRESILKDKLVAKSWLGVNIVAWCDGEGRICVAEAVCPHMGADLRPAGGGRCATAASSVRSTDSSSTRPASASHTPCPAAQNRQTKDI